MAFRIGQKVKCVGVKRSMVQRWSRRGFTFPVVGNTYTVRANCDRSELPSVLVFEIANPSVRFGHTKRRGEASFPEQWFVPVDERATDIAVFTAMLKGELIDVR